MVLGTEFDVLIEIERVEIFDLFVFIKLWLVLILSSLPLEKIKGVICLEAEWRVWGWRLGLA